MTAADYLSGAFGLIKLASPFLFIAIATFYTGEMIELIRKAILGRKKGEW